MSELNAAWDDLRTHLREIEVLGGVGAAIRWDQQTMMPKAGAQNRGEQSALLSRLIHERAADPRVGEWLAVLEASDQLDEVQSATLRNLGRDYARVVKVPSSLIERLAIARSAGFQAWVSAKESNDFKAFAPYLQGLLDLVVERAQAIDDQAPVYGVLLEEFNPGTNSASLHKTFSRLARGLHELIDAIANVAPLAPLSESFPVGQQQVFMRQMASSVGYDFGAGRLDKAAHPFTISLGPGDVRITTRLHENDLLGGLGGTIHEAGHGMYEQGLPQSLRGTKVNTAASLGLHESQSRFWENFIGRSEPFFKWMVGPLREHFPASQVSASDLYRAANRVRPSLIRVTADEVTYNLHIIIRYELESALFAGELAVEDLPGAWNEKYEKYLGVKPSTSSEGVLQDIHWAGAGFGYFPSYTIGNLYAASLGVVISESLGDIWSLVEAGDFAPILAWLRENIHSQGHLLDAPDRIQAVVGERDSVEDLLSYLWARHGVLHGVTRS